MACVRGSRDTSIDNLSQCCDGKTWQAGFSASHETTIFLNRSHHNILWRPGNEPFNVLLQRLDRPADRLRAVPSNMRR